MDNKLIYKLYSFDIFDTLITRTTATPDGIFLIIQDKLLKGNYDVPDFIKKNFYLIRKNTGNFTRFSKQGIKEEITIYDIYENISNNNYLSDEQRHILIDLEIETEIENSVPITANINKLKELVNSGKNVVLISDMYLPSNVIKNMLLKHSSIFNDIKIYVSCDLDKTKNSGNLYKLVKELEMVDYTDWLHIGDNFHSDIYMANNLSINTIHFQTKLNDFELDIINNHSNDIDINKLIGITKNLKLLNDCNSIQKEIGISIGGPILFFYVNWIIDTAIQQNIVNLYFLSRDGFILKNIADSIIEYRNISTIKTHYFYVSTYTSGVPLISIDKTIPLKIFYKQISTISDLKYLFDESIDKIINFLPKKYNSLNRIISRKEKIELKSIIENNPILMDMVIKKSIDLSDIFLKYLKQEINFNETFAFIDFAGRAGTINAISKILMNNGIYCEKIEMLYVSCLLSSRLNSNINIRTFSSSDIYYYKDYFEALIRAMHGENIGYVQKDNIVVPILDEKELNVYKEIKYEEYIEGVMIFVKKYLDVFNLSCGGLYIFNIYVNRFYNEIDKYKSLKHFVTSVPNNFRNLSINEKATFIKSILYLLKLYDYETVDFQNTSDKNLKFIYNFRLKYGSIFEFLLKINLKSKNPYIVILGLKITFGFFK